jgi:hypothetical protein
MLMFDVYEELEAGAYTQKEVKQGGIFASLNPNRTTHRPSVHNFVISTAMFCRALQIDESEPHHTKSEPHIIARIIREIRSSFFNDARARLLIAINTQFKHLKGLGSVENNTLGQVLPHQSTTQITTTMVNFTNTDAIESVTALFAFISLVESVKESEKNIICVEKSSKIHRFSKSTATT